MCVHVDEKWITEIQLSGKGIGVPKLLSQSNVPLKMPTLSFEMPHWHGQIHHIWQHQMFSRDEQCTEKIMDKKIIRMRRNIEKIWYYITASKSWTMIYIYKRRDYHPIRYPHCRIRDRGAPDTHGVVSKTSWVYYLSMLCDIKYFTPCSH
jgi:hypothetical protein